MIKIVPIASVKPDPQQPRKIFDEKHIKGLAQSLLTEGIINPIEVDESLMIITGECRWRAANKFGWKEVKVNINSSNLSEYERLRRQMAENVHQSGTSKDNMMNPIDTAKGYANLYKMKTGHEFKPSLPGSYRIRDTKGHYSAEGRAIVEMSKEIGVDDATIYEFLNLLHEPKYVLEDIISGRPRTYYREASVEYLPKEIQTAIKKKIAAGHYNNREQIRHDTALIKVEPDSAQLVLARKQAKESSETNRILTQIAKLVLALEALPLNQIDIREKGIIQKQLEWLQDKVTQYLSIDIHS